jgi:CheY-like chemotaxis protein
MKTVLTVDDSKVVRALIARNLGDYGVRVVEAENGRDGVDAARLHQPDLILLDVTMPVMDGREALTALRSDPVTRSIPVIMLAAESGEDLIGELMRFDVVGHIVKPFLQATFDAEVSKVLGWPGDTESVGRVEQEVAAAVARVTERALAETREAVAAADEVLQGLLEDVNGCAVLTLPDRSTALAQVVPAVARHLRVLRDAGQDTVVVDLMGTACVTAEQVSSLVRVLVDARSLGMRTAVCARDESVMTSLRGWEATAGTVCATTRELALEQLR